MKCEVCKKQNAKCWIRGKRVCEKCYSILKKDNRVRFLKGIRITQTTNILKETKKFFNLK